MRMTGLCVTGSHFVPLTSSAQATSSCYLVCHFLDGQVHCGDSCLPHSIGTADAELTWSVPLCGSCADADCPSGDLHSLAALGLPVCSECSFPKVYMGKRLHKDPENSGCSLWHSQGQGCTLAASSCWEPGTLYSPSLILLNYARLSINFHITFHIIFVYPIPSTMHVIS